MHWDCGPGGSSKGKTGIIGVLLGVSPPTVPCMWVGTGRYRFDSDVRHGAAAR